MTQPTMKLQEEETSVVELPIEIEQVYCRNYGAPWEDEFVASTCPCMDDSWEM